MKKTIYFTSQNRGTSELAIAINDAVLIKEEFLKLNKDIIVKIDNEDLKITTWGGNRTYVFATILLTFYTK